LSRFDGQQFLSIPLTDKKIKNALSGNSVNNNNNNNNNNLSTTNAILCIMQSKTGKLWFGTNDGVYCYDGKSFSIFLDNDSIINKDKLCLKSVESIMEDKNGNIWFGSYVNEGVCLYDGKSLTRPFSSILLNKFSNKRIMCIKEDKNGIIWFGAGAGTYYYDGKNLTNITEQAAIYWTYSIFEDRNGDFWLCNTWHKYKFDFEKTIKSARLQYHKTKGIGDAQIFGGEEYIYYSHILEDHDGTIWLTTWDKGVYKYDGKNIINYSVREDNKVVNLVSMYKDKKGSLWLGTLENGAFKFNGDTFEKFN